MIEQMLAASPVFTPTDASGSGAVEPVRGDANGSGADDPAHGRRVPHAAESPCAAATSCAARAHEPFGVDRTTMADRLITTGSDGESSAGPGAESDMVTESHRRASRQALLAAALAETLGDRVVEGYALERTPGSAPDVIHPDPPVRIGTILDIVA